jgi:hypothetical protein
MDSQAKLSKRWVPIGAFVLVGLLNLTACTGSKVTPIPTSPWDASYLLLVDAGQTDLPVAMDAAMDTPMDIRPADTARDLAPDRGPDGTARDVTPDLSYDLTAYPETRDLALPRDGIGQ